MLLRSFILVLVLALGACGTTSQLPRGDAAYSVIPAYGNTAEVAEYRIGPLDTLKIGVFQEEDLSLEEVPVDASGNILFPLIGRLNAAGSTSTQLADEIAARLDARYLVDPQVTVIVSRSASQKITVEGAVAQPGIFEIEGNISLLQAVALARGPVETANLDEIIVFREIEDSTYGAQFDLNDIRAGREPNPAIQSGDIIVVGNSFAKALFRDFLQLSPILSTVFIRLDGR